MPTPSSTAELKLPEKAKTPPVLCRMESGWAVFGDVQVLNGYCLLLPDPVIPTLNDLAELEREKV